MGDAATSTVWHDGEKAMQRGASVAEWMEPVGRRNVHPFMSEQHRSFFAQLSFLIAGSVDADGAPWATILAGDPGFVSSPTPTRLDIAARPSAGDPAGIGMSEGDGIGLLGIELHTRRRNRANGTIRTLAPDRIGVEVEQSFGNCPQYIQQRDVAVNDSRALASAPAIEEMDDLDAAARDVIMAADTFFVSSYVERDGRRQVDVSHRGGKPGFVRLGADGALTIPDFSGNLYFMTLGNILITGRAGIVFPDWATGDLLQLTGDAAVVTGSPEIASFAGAERFWTVRPHRVVRRRGALRLRWALRENGWSPNTMMTGDWGEATALGARWRRFRVARIVDESRSIRSFHLASTDGFEAMPAKAGQYLTIRLPLSDASVPAVRSYTLSGPPGLGYRISVKRDGAVSRHLHDVLNVGDTIEARVPAGDFVIDAREARHAVLIAGGIGITPLLAMLYHLVLEGARTGVTRPTLLLHAAHSKAERPFDDEISVLIEQAHSAIRVVRVLGQTADAIESQDYEALGRIDTALLARHLPIGDCDFYLCGPSAFMRDLYKGLRELNVPDTRIHAESFGSAALSKDVPAASAQPFLAPVATGPVLVGFVASHRTAQWTPASGSLLDLAERNGLTPAYGCRAGHCGSCRTRLLAGTVTYLVEPAAGLAADDALICCAQPAEGGAPIRLNM